MNKYDKNLELFDKLRDLSVKHNIIIMTAQQHSKPDTIRNLKVIKNRYNPIIIDHVNKFTK